MNAKLIRDNLANLLVKIKHMDVHASVADSGSANDRGLILIQNKNKNAFQ